jgi:hypothetical protein
MANEKALELFKDEGFLGELGKTGSAEEAQKLFASRGVDVTINELLALRAKIRQEAGEELSDEDLALVAGGGIDTLMMGPRFGPDLVKRLEEQLQQSKDRW